MVTEKQKNQSLLYWPQLIFFIAAILYFGQALFIPLSFSLLVALILYPMCSKLEKNKWPRSLAITFSLLIVVILFVALGWLFVWQVKYLRQDIPALSEKLEGVWQQVEQWLAINTNLRVNSQEDWLQQLFTNTGSTATDILKGFFAGITNFLFILFIIPVFTALFLYHREQFVNFIQSIFSQKYNERLRHILHETSFTYYKYIIGLIKVYLIVGTLNSIGLLLLGIEHAILFGMLTAFMTMIPYVGIMVSALLPITVAWLTKGSLWYPLGVVAVFSFVQYLENSVIFPRVVGTELKVSTWAILVSLIAGGLLWGISGMVLFMPFVAILKIISDDIEEWKPINILLSR